jgi:hypothetical protein
VELHISNSILSGVAAVALSLSDLKGIVSSSKHLSDFVIELSLTDAEVMRPASLHVLKPC